MVERQHVLLGLEHELSSIREALSKGAGQVIPTLHQHSNFLQAKHRPQSSGDHALVGLWDPLQQVSGEMNPAALPAAALEHSAYCLGKAHGVCLLVFASVFIPEQEPCKASFFHHWCFCFFRCFFLRSTIGRLSRLNWNWLKRFDQFKKIDHLSINRLLISLIRPNTIDLISNRGSYIYKIGVYI